MKTISKIALALSLSLTFTAGQALADGSNAQRGAVVVDGATVKAVVVGPTTIHAYSQFKGGTLYSAKAVTGTDADCVAASRGDTTTLAADSVHSFTVGAGRVACIAGSADRSVELLWHVQKDAPAQSGTMLARR